MSDHQNTDGKKLERTNLMLTAKESAWLDSLADEIRKHTGAKVSRSEIVRAALSTLAELHRLAPIMPLHSCKSEGELAVAGILAIRSAALS